MGCSNCTDGYKGRTGIYEVMPVSEEIGRIIMDELVYGIFKPTSIEYFRSVIGGLKEQGCEAVILGCTEIPLIIDDENSPLPTLDSTRLLARAALRHAIGSASGR